MIFVSSFARFRLFFLSFSLVVCQRCFWFSPRLDSIFHLFAALGLTLHKENGQAATVQEEKSMRQKRKRSRAAKKEVEDARKYWQNIECWFMRIRSRCEQFACFCPSASSATTALSQMRARTQFDNCKYELSGWHNSSFSYYLVISWS